MIALTVSLQVIPGRRDAFLEAIEENARHTVADEPGCRSFEVSCDVDDDHHFLFRELYEDEAAVESHRKTPHYQAWRDTAATCVIPGSQINTLSRRLIHHA